MRVAKILDLGRVESQTRGNIVTEGWERIRNTPPMPPPLCFPEPGGDYLCPNCKL